MAKTSRRTGSSGAPSRAMSTKSAAPAKPAAAPVTTKAPIYPAPPPATAKSAAPASKPAAASAQHAPQTQQQQQHYAPPPAAAPASQGPGMMATIAANAASIAAGHVVAKSVDRMIWGSGSGSSAEAAEAPAPEAAAPQQMYQQGPTQQYIANSCNFEVQEFQKCLQTNSNDSSACQMYFDMLTQCQKNAQENAKY
mmetsp:Transcript_5552/g.9874  ORF Transcript_5552/g.9874 Transcript_5552/m.9874 type:complete len:196 (+) Transcript_5552:197-784(+)|eukprot:CAMPEP_0184697900 /NCGR_PEP_ID=MMETSP0313-20130426/4688_1 /TAXON_ID=2792 /ORGANISM="Porphyridium aerugineum, Strain SAG 1380-2" /LENGTH=195 /DNA_ID=CAMNT_0027156745 /DNA_START=122 /DNA_END=709 /DNA_ORIENTATION=+